ncbi:MAG: hypothetical protein NTW30_05920 [Candidatus Aenigmarchaeota archaeon]|nr:hypothetical protein [Candidatus Aenigmarchaeota archaeon]
MKKSKCEICGKRYEIYPIIIDNNPLSIASLLEDETKPDGTERTICKECRDKLDKLHPLTKEKETTAGYIKTHYTNPYFLLFPSEDVRSAIELLKERYETTLRNKEHKGIIPVFNFDELVDSCFPVFKEEKKVVQIKKR